jgi:hypothetical protein
VIDSRWLFFVEDPGALNYFIPIVDYVVEKGIPFVLVANATALDYFRAASIPVLSQREFVLCDAEYSIGLVGTSEDAGSFGLEIIEMLKNSGVQVASIVDSGINSEYRFRGDSNEPLRFAPDYLFVPDKHTRNLFISLGVESQRISVVGYPIPERIEMLKKRSKKMARDLIRLSLPSGRPMITFISEISGGLNNEQYQLSNEYTMRGYNGYKARTHIVIEEIFSSVKKCSKRLDTVDPFMAIRLHPKETGLDLSEYPCSFDFMSQAPSDAYDLINASDLVIGMTSMLLSEAFWLGARCLSVVPRREERDWLPTVASGEIPCVYHRSELDIQMERFLSTYRNDGGRPTEFNIPPRYDRFRPASIIDSPFISEKGFND